MENASKALIMAGEIVIAVLVIGLFVYINVIFGSFSSNMNEKIASTKVIQFNNNFYKYAGRPNINTGEIASVINFAKQNNDSNNLSRTNSENSIYYVDVTINGKSFFNNNAYISKDSDYVDNTKLKEKINEFISLNNKYFFSCDCKVNINQNEKIITAKLNTDDILTNSISSMVNKINFNIVETDKYNVLNEKEYTIQME